jgi:hypothetical protein
MVEGAIQARSGSCAHVSAPSICGLLYDCYRLVITYCTSRPV